MARPFENDWYDFRNTWLSTQARRITLVVCLALILGAIVGTQHYRIASKYETFYASMLGDAETVFLPPKPVLRAAAIGREEFLSDMLYWRAQAYFVRHLFADRIYDWLENYIDAIIYLDPDNVLVYKWATRVVKYRQEITNREIALAIHYDDVAIERFPNDWFFHFDKGFNLYNEWQYVNDDEKRELRAKATEHFRTAYALPNSGIDPNFINELLMRNEDTKIALLQAKMSYHAADKDGKKMLAHRIANLDSEAAVRETEKQDAAWRDNLGFVPFTLYLLIDETTDSKLPKSWRPGELL